MWLCLMILGAFKPFLFKLQSIQHRKINKGTSPNKRKANEMPMPKERHAGNKPFSTPNANTTLEFSAQAECGETETQENSILLKMSG